MKIEDEDSVMGTLCRGCYSDVNTDSDVESPSATVITRPIGFLVSLLFSAPL